MMMEMMQLTPDDGRHADDEQKTDPMITTPAPKV